MTYTEPLILIFVLIGLLGLVRLRHCKRRRLASISIFGFLLLSWPPVDWLLSRPLEARYPVQPFRTPLDPQAIVVLGSAVAPSVYERPYPLPDEHTFQRCQYAA